MHSFTRRELLAGAGAAALLHAAPRKPVVAAHIWVYASTMPKHEVYPILDQVFADLHYAGIEAIELMETTFDFDDAVPKIRALSAKHKLPVMGTSYWAETWDRAQHPKILADAERRIARLAEVGGRRLGMSVGDAKRRKTPAELDAQAEVLKKLIGVCDKHKVALNLHNHTVEVADGEYDLKGTIERVPEVKLGPDLDWLRGAGVDPIDFIRRNGPRITYCHLRDRDAKNVWTEALGEGTTDFAAIRKALDSVGFTGDVAIELAFPPDYQPKRPIREDFKISREYVRRVMGW